jgi:hypothetical protein
MIVNGVHIDSLKSCSILAYFSLVYIVGDFILYQINQKQLTILVKSYFVFNLLLMIADLLYRFYYGKTTADQYSFSNPLYQFYIFKGTSLLHMDSNGSGFIILTILSVLVYMKDAGSEGKKRFINKMYVLFFILLILSFSRSCLIAHLCLLLFIHLFVKRSIYFKFLVAIISIFLGAYVLNIVFTNLIYDYSFQTKIIIFIETFEYIQDATMSQLLFGNGAESSINFLSFGAHNFISSYIIDTGLISLLLHIVILIMISIDMGRNWYIVLIPYFISSLSYNPMVIPYVFVAALLIKHIKIKHYKV